MAEMQTLYLELGATSGTLPTTASRQRIESIALGTAAIVLVAAYLSVAAGDRNAAFAGLSAPQHFVQALYLDELGRAGSVAEVDGWLPVLNGFNGQTAVAQDIAHQVAAMRPRWVTREDVPEDVVAGERRIAEQMTREEGKPEAAIAKIVDGRVNAFLKDVVLV